MGYTPAAYLFFIAGSTIERPSNPDLQTFLRGVILERTMQVEVVDSLVNPWQPISPGLCHQEHRALPLVDPWMSDFYRQRLMENFSTPTASTDLPPVGTSSEQSP